MEKFPKEPTEPDLNVGRHFFSEVALEIAYMRIQQHELTGAIVDGTVLRLIEDLTDLKNNSTTSVDDIANIQGDIHELKRYMAHRGRGETTNDIDLVVSLARDRLNRARY